MKTKLIFIGLLATNLLPAQNLRSSAEKMNTIKTNVMAYAFRNINVSYERSFSKTIALNIGFATMPTGGVPFMDTFIKGDDRKEIGDVKLGTTAITIEPRFYFGEKYNSGFYLAPYYRYTNIKVDELRYNYVIYDEATQTEMDNPIDLNGKFSANSFGLMLGVQWLLGSQDNWVLDFWIVGGHYGSASGDLVGKTQYTLTPDQQKELQDELNDLQIPLVKHKTEINANGGTVKLDGPWAGLRSGLSFGYRF
ncbi:DUF3575 domain-containing protein [Soonwooa sp.]|uniref:DUF3575 domain-containing protein n=1 Tax=Soonwooa sp. TaxID=1938592 RepID=UPI0028ADE461|nr:DUF3575 domain-containing protein [Soonwooa sp.]